MDKVRPCPFCGCKYTKDDDDFWYSGDHETWCWMFQKPGLIDMVPDVEEEIRAWNRRATDG